MNYVQNLTFQKMFQNLDQYSQISDYFESLDDSNKDKFYEIVTFAQGILTDSELEWGFVNGYNNQPRGYNATPMLLFANFNQNTGNVIPGSWKFRIPLTSAPHTIIINTSIKLETLANNLVTFGIDPNFMPNDLEDFLKNPQKYIKLE